MAVRKKPSQYKFANIWDFDVTLSGVLAAGTGQVLSLSAGIPLELQDTTVTHRITIDRGNVASKREVMEVSYSGGQFTTVTRGLENTTDQSHEIGETVAVTITAGDMTTLYDMLDTLKNGYVYHASGLAINFEEWTGYIGSTLVTATPVADLTLADNTTSLVEVVSTGLQVVNSWTNGSERLATVTTLGNTVTAIKDERTINNANNASRDVNMMLFDATANVSVASGAGFFIVPASLNGLSLSGVKAKVITQGSGGGATTIDVVNATGGATFLSAPLSITGTTVLTTATTITNTMATDDVIQVNVTGAETTPARGLILLLTFS